MVRSSSKILARVAKKAAKRTARPKPTRKPTRAKAKPRTATAKTPAPPKWLSPIAAAQWKRLAKSLTLSGHLTPLDVSAFEAYCESYALWKQSQLWLNEPNHKPTIVLRDKDGKVKQLAAVPHVGIARNALADMVRLGALFGLSPADRVGSRAKSPATQPRNQPAAQSQPAPSSAAEGLADLRRSIGVPTVN